MASRPSHNSQLRERVLNSLSRGLEPAASIHSSLAAIEHSMTCAVDHTSHHAFCCFCLRNPLLHVLLFIYRPRKDERPLWLTYSGQFTHKVVTCSTISQEQDRASSPVKEKRSTSSTTVQHR